MKSLFRYAIFWVFAASAVGCRWVPANASPDTVANLKRQSSGLRVERQSVESRGYMSLAFERQTVCDELDRSICLAIQPTEQMLIYREAYNRNVVSFRGFVSTHQEPSSICARDCSYPIVRITDAEPPARLLGKSMPKFLHDPLDIERVVLEGTIDRETELRQLADGFMSFAISNSDKNLSTEPAARDFLGAVDQSRSETIDPARIGQRIRWIGQILRHAAETNRVERLMYRMAQVRDDLEPQLLSSDSVVCYCLQKSCKQEAMRLEVTDQSVNDTFMCLPANRNSGSWKFDREFFGR